MEDKDNVTWFPIQTLHVCAAAKCVVQVTTVDPLSYGQYIGETTWPSKEGGPTKNNEYDRLEYSKFYDSPMEVKQVLPCRARCSNKRD